MSCTEPDGSPAIPQLPVTGPVVNFVPHRRTATDRFTGGRRESGKHRRRRPFSGVGATMITPEEYGALPPSIQRKYFNSKERLEIAKQSASQRRKKRTGDTWLQPPTPTDHPTACHPRPATSAGICELSSRDSAHASKLSLIRMDQDTISEQQARWYLLLPDKIREQQFSREENVILMVRCEQVLEDVAPELAKDVYRHCLSTTKGDSMSYISRKRPVTSCGIGFEESKSFLSMESASPFSTEDVDKEMEIFELYSPPDHPETTDQVTIPTPPLPPPEPKELANIEKPKRKSLHRKLSLTPLPLPAPTLAPPVPPIARLPSVDSIRHFAFSAGLSRPSIENLSGSLEPPTERKHYRDPDARKQLRNALASPENFDEALAFGFCSADESAPSTSATDEYFPIQQPMLYNSEHEDEDTHSIETQSPRTPTTLSDDQAAVKQPSFDSGVDFPRAQIDRPKTPKTPIIRSPAGSVGTREMTIHMTLTRQDLRSPEEVLYDVERQQNSGVTVEKVDPLALEALQVCDDPTGAHGAFAVHDNPKGLKRVWKTLKRH